jgi:hypothetical protein
MERKRITCPEIAHLVEVDVERTPFGVVIAGCSRFEPRCAVACAGECARRMDRHEREHEDDRNDRVLVLYTNAPFMRPVIETLAQDFGRDGMTVELGDVGSGHPPPPADYDAVVVCSPVRFNGHPRPIVDYVGQHRHALSTMPAFLFALSRNGKPRVGRLQRDTGWRPTQSFGVVRPSRMLRWFAESNARLASRIHGVALEIAEEIPGRT